MSSKFGGWVRGKFVSPAFFATRVGKVGMYYLPYKLVCKQRRRVTHSHTSFPLSFPFPSTAIFDLPVVLKAKGLW